MTTPTKYADLAESFVVKGGWKFSDGVTHEKLATAALFDIARSLRAIKQILSCRNLPAGLVAMQQLRDIAQTKERRLRKSRREASKKRKVQA